MTPHRQLKLAVTGCFVLFACAACRRGPATTIQPAAEDHLSQVRADAIRAHVTFLADDALEGRKPGTRGYDLAAKYIRSQLMSLGADGGVTPDDYFQPVPLVRTRVAANGTRLDVKGKGASKSLAYGTDYVLLDTHRDRQGAASGRVVSLVME
jgi:hypothetical protein